LWVGFYIRVVALALHIQASLHGGTLVAPEDIAPTVVRLNTSSNSNRLGNERSWPDYELCVKGAPVAREGGPDRKADFTWCMMAAQRGHSIEDIATRVS
jgi:hypothetical protein